MATSTHCSTTLCTLLFPTFLLNAEFLTYSTNEIWSQSSISYRRPPWSNNVTIIYDESQIWSVAGIVIPISTAGRPSAPDPYNGYTTGTSVGLDKGHLMALSNGGCDKKLNIVPQSATWQRTGGWRKLEIDIFNYASSKYGWDNDSPYHISEIETIGNIGSVNYVYYNVSIIGYNMSTGEPTKYKGFLVSGSDIYLFTIEPTQNAIWSDDMAPPENATHVPVTTENAHTTNAMTTNVDTTACDCNDNSSQQNNKESSAAVVWIIISCILMITNVLFIVLWMRARKMAVDIQDNSYNYVGHGL